jgi:hypothetical protein
MAISDEKYDMLVFRCMAHQGMTSLSCADTIVQNQLEHSICHSEHISQANGNDEILYLCDEKRGFIALFSLKKGGGGFHHLFTRDGDCIKIKYSL